ncbi:peroxide stress protein YaaA [Woodsholea maritima]|uniref:peroxide stress protein YaaA n=1 Tax=Woodsholea maritima TaxID=240237 RepID=UPI0003613C02|nr:peroxide stress protein YaaA [Woodsholea maritima]
MLILLSPAKALNFEPQREELATTRPAFMARTEALSKVTANLKAQDLKDLMGISDDLATLNVERFKAFHPQANEGLKAAALAFNGEVYRGLEAETLSETDLQWAQDHLRILSGFYGALRPLDAIQPYRLEMGTRLKNPKGNTLYDFWGDDIRAHLDELAKADPHPLIVNLASNEYAKAARPKALKTPVIACDFKEEKNGQLRALMVYAKKARGMMARWIIEEKPESLEDLKAFTSGGYRFQGEGAKPGTLLFTRPQPEKKT